MLPRSIKIGAHTYKIKTVTKKELSDEEDKSADVDDEENVIRIVRHAARSRKIELLLHESIHAMLAGTDFPSEEEIVLILGEALTRFLADNPIFVTEALKILSGPSPKKSQKHG